MNPVPETSSICCGTASLWKSLMKLTLPSETHTSWFCCSWMVSFNAPYQPSFMLFMLMVARGQSQEGRHQITQDNPAESGFFATNKRYICVDLSTSLHLSVCCTQHATSLVYVLINSSKGGSLLDSFTLQPSNLSAQLNLHLWGLYSKWLTNEQCYNTTAFIELSQIQCACLNISIKWIKLEIAARLLNVTHHEIECDVQFYE